MDTSTRNGYKHMKWIQEHMKWIHAHELDTSARNEYTKNGFKHTEWIQAHEMDAST